MDTILSSDDSCDSEVKNMKSELSEFGLMEENLTKEEMSDLLIALRNSRSTNSEEEFIRVNSKPDDTEIPESNPSLKTLKRRYLNVKDRRMPWSLLPGTLTQAEKARTLAVYIKLMSINNYKQARQSANFATWPPPIQIVEESTRVQPIRSTRSGRSVPIYSGFDDDSSDFDLIITKATKGKKSNSDNNDSLYSNKTISLKRKPSKDDNGRPAKESKMTETPRVVKPKKDLFTLVKD